MKSFRPYDINHIDLNERTVSALPAAQYQGSYNVIWWKDIALGDFYVDHDERPKEMDLSRRCAEAVRPAAAWYAERAEEKAELNLFARDQKIDDWTERFEKIFFEESNKKMPDRVDVSLIICTYDRPDELRACLFELRRMKVQPEEIIVVDNAPHTEKTREIVAQFPGVKYVAEPRKGLDYARNTGVRNAACPVVAFTDDDVKVHTDWIYRVWESFTDESVAAMTGLLITDALETEAQWIFEKYWSFNKGYLDKYFDSDFLRAEAPPVWNIGAGANMAFRKSIFAEVGLFHELLGAGASGCNDDSEMWFRILCAGRTIHYNPRAIAFHRHRSTDEKLKSQLYQYSRGFAAAVLWQHRQKPLLGYRRFVLFKLPLYLLKLSILGFPRYSLQYKTLWSQIKGHVAGLAFFYRRENRPYFTLKK